MATVPKGKDVSTPEREDAASEALLRLQTSAEEFLRYKDVYAETAETKKALRRIEAELQEKDSTIERLESAISVFTLGGNKEVSRVKVEIAEAIKELQLVTKEKQEVEAKAKNARELLATREKESTQLQNEVNTLKARNETLSADLKHELAAKRNTISQLDACKKRLDIYDSYTTNLVYLDPAKFSKSIQRVWKDTESLVKRYFSLDIPDDLFENHDKWIQQACNFLSLPAGSILVPHSNSPAAKLARQAVMLNVIALALFKWIFTAAPLLLTDGGLDNILLELMKQDIQKELLGRALLISGSAEWSLQDRDIHGLIQWLLEGFGTLSTPKDRTKMKADYAKLFEQANNAWSESRRSHQKIFATLDYESYPDSWTAYSEPRHQYEQSAKHTQVSDSEGEDEVAFFAFPAVMVRSSSGIKTVHRCVLVHYPHIREAEAEWRREQKKRRFSRTSIPHKIIGPPSFRGHSSSIAED